MEITLNNPVKVIRIILFVFLFLSIFSFISTAQSNYSGSTYGSGSYGEDENTTATNTTTTSEENTTAENTTETNLTIESPQEKVCIESWKCTTWSECTNGKELRVCNDNNKCNTFGEKPDESRKCIGETPVKKTDYTLWFIIGGGLLALIIIILILVWFLKHTKKEVKKEIVISETGKEFEVTKPNDALIKINKYIQDCLSKGFNLDKIENVLISSGWPKDVIKEAIGNLREKKETPPNNKELENYIENALRLGYQKWQLKEMLVKAGWPHAVIDEALRRAGRL